MSAGKNLAREIKDLIARYEGEVHAEVIKLLRAAHLKAKAAPAPAAPKK